MEVEAPAPFTELSALVNGFIAFCDSGEVPGPDGSEIDESIEGLAAPSHDPEGIEESSGEPDEPAGPSADSQPASDPTLIPVNMKEEQLPDLAWADPYLPDVGTDAVEQLSDLARTDSYQQVKSEESDEKGMDSDEDVEVSAPAVPPDPRPPPPKKQRASVATPRTPPTRSPPRSPRPAKAAPMAQPTWRTIRAEGVRQEIRSPRELSSKRPPAPPPWRRNDVDN